MKNTTLIERLENITTSNEKIQKKNLKYQINVIRLSTKLTKKEKLERIKPKLIKLIEINFRILTRLRNQQ